MSEALQKIEPAEIAVRSQAPDVAQMLQAIIERGVTSESVGAVEKLCALYERLEDRNAERAFAEAFKALQSELPAVQARKAVPGRDNSVRYYFAPYEEIMRQVSPLLLKHGFSVSFSTRYAEQRLIKSCTLTHERGHSKTNEFAVRIGSGPPGCTESQSDGAAGTYAKRFALCDCLNIVIEQDVDGDPRAEGGKITKDQAEDLRQRVRATGSDEARFLRYAGSASYEEISTSKYAMLDENLRRKERTA